VMTGKPGANEPGLPVPFGWSLVNGHLRSTARRLVTPSPVPRWLEKARARATLSPKGEREGSIPRSGEIAL
jgi:hypothetical protein